MSGSKHYGFQPDAEPEPEQLEDDEIQVQCGYAGVDDDEETPPEGVEFAYIGLLWAAAILLVTLAGCAIAWTLARA